MDGVVLKLDSGNMRKLANLIYANQSGDEDAKLIANAEAGVAGALVDRDQFKALHEFPDLCRQLYKLMQCDLELLRTSIHIQQHVQASDEQLAAYQQASTDYLVAYDAYHVTLRLIEPDNQSLKVPKSGYLNKVEQNAMG